MNLDAFRHKLSQSKKYPHDYFGCVKCGFFTPLTNGGTYGFCDDLVYKATNDTFGTTFAHDTPIPIIADFVEEHDDGTPEFGELVKFLRGITPKRSITDNLSYVPLTEVVWGL